MQYCSSATYELRSLVPRRVSSALHKSLVIGCRSYCTGSLAHLTCLVKLPSYNTINMFRRFKSFLRLIFHREHRVRLYSIVTKRNWPHLNVLWNRGDRGQPSTRETPHSVQIRCDLSRSFTSKVKFLSHPKREISVKETKIPRSAKNRPIVSFVTDRMTVET